MSVRMGKVGGENISGDKETERKARYAQMTALWGYHLGQGCTVQLQDGDDI